MTNNDYPYWWNSTVTLYNRFEDSTTQEVTWQRTVLTNCFWKVHVNTDFSSGQMSETSSPIVTCRIPKNTKFVDAYTWKTLGASARTNKFTLQNGDILIKGIVTDTIDEYTKGSRSSDLIEKYKDKGLMRMTLFVDNSDKSLPIKHYFVR